MTFKVCVHRYVEEIASIEIEADSAEKAAELATQMLVDGDIDGWEPGEDVVNYDFLGGIYCVLDASGEAVWEPTL